MRTSPADSIFFATALAFLHIISRCSGANSFTNSTHALSFLQIATKPLFCRLDFTMSDRVIFSTINWICRCTCDASFSEFVTKPQIVSVLCSAWDTRSTATSRGSAVVSAYTSNSVGPATMSIETVLEAINFAAVTNMPPGPTILLTGLTDSVP